MISRVGRVALKLRLGAVDGAEADKMRQVVERVVIQQAIDELERLVTERFGRATIVRVRRLSARWRLDQASIAEPATAIELGRDLATSLIAEIEALPKPHRLRPVAEANIVAFADDDHAIAAFLADAADLRTAWFHAPRENAVEVWRVVLSAGPERVAAVVRWLERMECRTPVVRWLESMEHRAEAVAPSASRTDPPSLHELAHGVAPVPATAPARQAPAPPVIEALDRASAGLPSAVDAGFELVSNAAATAALPVELDPIDEPTVQTEIAGVWYLARLVLELELAEQLWAVGVREGDFLVHVAAAAVGFTGDPACRWFGGAFEREPVLDPLAAWAADELELKLDAALRRLGLDPTPDSLVERFACLAPDPDPRAAGIVARFAAALCQLFCARLGLEPDPERMRAALRVPGRLVFGAPLQVVMAMDRIDVELRRAGLDFDPGHLPWLDRKVRIVFDTGPS